MQPWRCSLVSLLVNLHGEPKWLSFRENEYFTYKNNDILDLELTGGHHFKFNLSKWKPTVTIIEPQSAVEVYTIYLFSFDVIFLTKSLSLYTQSFIISRSDPRHSHFLGSGVHGISSSSSSSPSSSSPSSSLSTASCSWWIILHIAGSYRHREE